jgi:ribonucleotide reductase alpha subunit
MSFLKIGDRAAGAIKSGGTTRRAAKMVIVDVDHPDIEDLHRLEGDRGAEGRRARHRLQDLKKHLNDHEGLRQLRRPATTRFDPAKNPALKRAIKAAQARR